MKKKKDSDGGGLRFNKGKIDLDQCPTSIIAAVALGFMKNSTKYGGKYPDNNWRRGMDHSTPYNCMLRHLMQYKDGEDLDVDSGLPHLYHAACNLAMLIEYMETFPEGDDRIDLKVRSLDNMETLSLPEMGDCDTCGKKVEKHSLELSHDPISSDDEDMIQTCQECMESVTSHT